MAISAVQAKYDELLSFFQFWIPEVLPGIPFLLVGQAVQREANPYITFDPMKSIDYVGNDERRINPVTGIETLRGQRVVTVELFGYSDSTTRYSGANNAWSMLQELRFSLRFPAVYEAMNTRILRVLDEGQVMNVSQTLNTVNEPQASLQIELSTVITQTIDNGAVETINATGSTTGATGAIGSGFSVSKP
jgi:hypothetical protein